MIFDYRARTLANLFPLLLLDVLSFLSLFAVLERLGRGSGTCTSSRLLVGADSGRGGESSGGEGREGSGRRTAKSEGEHLVGRIGVKWSWWIESM